MIRGKSQITPPPSPRRAFRTCGCRSRHRRGDYAKQSQSCPVSHGRGRSEPGNPKHEDRNSKQTRKANDQDAPETENKANRDRRARQTNPISGFSGQKRGSSEETNPIEANSPGSRRAREIRSSKLEIRNKSEMQMLETNHSAPNEPNWAGAPPLGIGDCELGIRGGEGGECQTKPICGRPYRG